MAVSTTEFSHVFFSIGVGDSTVTMRMEIISIAYVDISIWLGNFGVADEASLHPFSLKFLAIREH